MTEQLVLRALQAILIIALIGMAILYTVSMRRNKINPFRKFVPGFLIG